MSLTERKKREIADELVRTAVELFARDGFEATSIEAITEPTGCSRRTFYRYFGTKEDVLFHDVPELIDALCATLEERLAEHPAWEALTEAVVERLGRYARDEERLPVARMELWLTEPRLHDRYVQHIAAAEAAIVQTLCRHRGTDPSSDDLAHVMAISAIGAYRTAVATHGRRRDGRDLPRHLRDLMGTLGAGLAVTDPHNT